MHDPNRQTRLRDLIVGLLLALGGGVVVTVVGFIATLVYLFTTGHLHAANRSAASLYLIAPLLGVSFAIIGCGITIVNWVKSGHDADRSKNARG